MLPVLKSGVQTTEFWQSLIQQGLGLMLASGILPQGGQVAQAIGGALTIWSAWQYHKGRIDLKKAFITAALAVEQSVASDMSGTTSDQAASSKVNPLPSSTPAAPLVSGGAASPKA